MSVGLSRPSDLRGLIYKGLYFRAGRIGAGFGRNPSRRSSVRVHFGHFPVPRMACLRSMYPIPSRDSSTGPSVAGARCRTRLRWHSSGRLPAGPGGYPGGLARQGRIAGSCLLIVRRPLPQTRQVNSGSGDNRPCPTLVDCAVGDDRSFRALGVSSRASAARTQASFRLRQRLARKP